MRLKEIVLIFLCLLFMARARKIRSKDVRWWSIAGLGPSNEVSPAAQMYNNPSLSSLTKRQRRLVTKNPGSVLAVAEGSRMAIEECKSQFQHRRWNCPTYESGRTGSVFGKILDKGARETAFLYAITSAAVSQAVARACSEGTIYTCTCDFNYGMRPPAARDWEWGGCSDNVKFGHKFSRRFVDVVEKGQDFRYMMNIHNNEAGRMHVKTGMQQECKCHGMSGSCTIKTCWMRLSSFRTVGLALKDRFDGASKVLPGNAGNRDLFEESRNGKKKRRRRKFKFIPANPRHKRPGKKDLVYYENSPNFCDPDNTIGFKGTTGRLCNDSSIGIDGCDLMCCGRGFKTESYIVRERCSCTFHWCCHVNCKVCTRIKVRHTCH